jgi:hypothetical protein
MEIGNTIATITARLLTRTNPTITMPIFAGRQPGFADDMLAAVNAIPTISPGVLVDFRAMRRGRVVRQCIEVLANRQPRNMIPEWQRSSSRGATL